MEYIYSMSQNQLCVVSDQRKRLLAGIVIELQG